jgi:hypothetical protein
MDQSLCGKFPLIWVKQMTIKDQNCYRSQAGAMIEPIRQQQMSLPKSSKSKKKQRIKADCSKRSKK